MSNELNNDLHKAFDKEVLRLIYGGGFLSRKQADSASRLMTPQNLLIF